MKALYSNFQTCSNFQTFKLWSVSNFQTFKVWKHVQTISFPLFKLLKFERLKVSKLEVWQLQTLSFEGPEVWKFESLKVWHPSACFCGMVCWQAPTGYALKQEKTLPFFSFFLSATLLGIAPQSGQHGAQIRPTRFGRVSGFRRFSHKTRNS